MSNKISLKPIITAIGATFAVSLAASPVANANENPFALKELSGGFTVAAEEMQKCGSICGGANPTMKDGEMVKCGNVCGEVTKCGTICGGVAGATKSMESGKDTEIAKCGNICAAVK